MAEINSVTIIGRLTREPETKFTQGGMCILKMSIAVNRRKKDGEQWVDEANFFDVDHIGKAAESVSKYLKKGSLVAIQGELRQERWTDKEGQARSKVGIHALSVKLLDKRDGQAQGDFIGAKSKPAQSMDGDFDDDTIPF